MNQLIKIYLTTLFSWLLLLSCTSDEGCYYFPGSDIIKLLDQVKKGDRVYYLMIRTIGFQDKASILELYDAKPNVTPCGETDRKPIWIEDIDDEHPGKFVKKVILKEQAQRKLEIVYTQNKNEALDIYHLTLSEDE